MRALILTMLLAGILLGCTNQEASNEVPWLARVGDETITEGEVFDEVRLLAGDEFIPDIGSEAFLAMQQSALEDLISRKLLLQEAKRRQVVLPQDALDERLRDLFGSALEADLQTAADKVQMSVNDLIKRTAEQATIQRLFREEIYSRILVKEQEAKAAFDKQPERYAQPEMVRVKQIVVATEEEATQVRRRLFRGEAFEDLAQELSITPEKELGGDLGWVHRGKLPDPFHLVFDLPRRTPNKPIKSDFGYHIFMITDHLPARQLTFEQVRMDLEKELFEEKKTEAEETLMKTLRRRFPVELNPGFAEKTRVSP